MSSSIERWPNGRCIWDFDYVSQLDAIRGLLSHNWQTEADLLDEISDAGAWAEGSTGDANDFAVSLMGDLMNRSIYQAVAHSMAAVGMIAPFMEGVFKDGFERMGEELPRVNLAMNILKLVEKKELMPYMPDELAPTLEALFRYRNNLFHSGFEWPEQIRQQFKDATHRWPDGWFDEATQDSDPWMFSMSATSIKHCVKVAEEVTNGLQDLLIDEEREENGLPRLGKRKDRDSFTW